MGLASSDREAWVSLSVAMASKDDPLSDAGSSTTLCAQSPITRARGTTRRHTESAASGPQMVMVSPELTEIGALSWLWVLGAYEVFRRAKIVVGALFRTQPFNR